MEKLKRKKQDKPSKKKISAVFLLLFLLCPFLAMAQSEAMVFTITPPLIKNNVSPGQEWHSAVRVVNNNPQAMDLYAKVMDFKGGGETGHIQFLKENELEGGKNFLLSKWVLIDPGPYSLPPYGSKDIPFVVKVPEDAEPGGHYAAVLVGTQPPDKSAGGSVLKVSSLIGSLLLLSVQGDIEERGWIREFSTNKSVYTEPDVNFSVKFENAGNVHIQPRGEIRITTMFGQEKEAVKVNHASEFNNVLPGDIRKWEFSWGDKKNILEMGRYKAEVILTYGEQTKETITQTTYFWIIYLKPLIAFSSALTIFILLLILFIRFYIRRSLAMTQAQIQAMREEEATAVEPMVKKKRILAQEDKVFVKKSKAEKQKEMIATDNMKEKKVKMKKKASGPVDLRGR